MSSVYTVSMENVTIVANATLVIIRAATAVSSRGSSLVVTRCAVSQQGTSTAQQLGIQIGQKASAFGTYTSMAPSPHAIGGVASAIAGGTAGAAATSGVNASAEGAGTVSDIFSDGFNNLAGWLYVPTPEERILIQPDQAFILKLRGTPTTLTGWNAYVTFIELS